jgi:hypothetical protein
MLLRVDQVAELLGCSDKLVADLVDRGELKDQNPRKPGVQKHTRKIDMNEALEYKKSFVLPVRAVAQHARYARESEKREISDLITKKIETLDLRLVAICARLDQLAHIFTDLDNDVRAIGHKLEKK